MCNTHPWNGGRRRCTVEKPRRQKDRGGQRIEFPVDHCQASRSQYKYLNASASFAFHRCSYGWPVVTCLFTVCFTPRFWKKDSRKKKRKMKRRRRRKKRTGEKRPPKTLRFSFSSWNILYVRVSYEMLAVRKNAITRFHFRDIIVLNTNLFLLSCVRFAV